MRCLQNSRSDTHPIPVTDSLSSRLWESFLSQSIRNPYTRWHLSAMDRTWAQVATRPPANVLRRSSSAFLGVVMSNIGTNVPLGLNECIRSMVYSQIMPSVPGIEPSFVVTLISGYWRLSNKRWVINWLDRLAAFTRTDTYSCAVAWTRRAYPCI